MRSSFTALLLAGLLCFGQTGCGKVPTWGELSGGTPPPAPAPVAVPAQPTLQTVQVAPPAPPDPQEVIAKFKSLRPSEVSDGALLQLTGLNEGLDQITEINAEGSLITGIAFTSIGKLTNLQQLRLSGTRVDNDTCQKIAQISSLEVLVLTGTPVSDVGVAAISNMQNLKHLELTRCHLGNNGYAAIGQLPSLKYLALEQTGMSNDQLNLVCNAKTITSLKISQNNLNDYGLVALKKLGSLESLELSLTSITGEGLKFAQKSGGLKTLTALGLYACPLSADGVKVIGSLKSMERLNIGEVALLNDEALDYMISNMKNLKYLNLSKCSNINGQGLIGLKGNKQIEELHIDQCPNIGDGVVQFLSTLKSLKWITVSGSSITPAGMNHLKAAIPDCKVQ